MNILETHHIVKQYEAHRALDDVSLAVPEGSIFGLLGPNGAGKTSLIRIINQITAPDAGEVQLMGQKLNPNHIRHIGYLPEERGLYKKMKVGEQLLYLTQLKGLSEREAAGKLKRWIEKFEMQSWWNKSIEDLSKGMQQKVQFVATVAHDPELIILDEPFSGFDPINASLIRDEILELRQRGRTIIFSTHRMESVEELCDHIALINRSRKVLDGSKQAIRERFRTHTYRLEHQGDLGLLPDGFSVVKTQPLDDGYAQTDIQVLPQTPTNDLLRLLLDRVAIRRFGENIPSMNEIFIRTVGETMN